MRWTISDSAKNHSSGPSTSNRRVVLAPLKWSSFASFPARAQNSTNGSNLPELCPQWSLLTASLAHRGHKSGDWACPGAISATAAKRREWSSSRSTLQCTEPGWASGHWSECSRRGAPMKTLLRIGGWAWAAARSCFACQWCWLGSRTPGCRKMSDWKHWSQFKH